MPHEITEYSQWDIFTDNSSYELRGLILPNGKIGLKIASASNPLAVSIQGELMESIETGKSLVLHSDGQQVIRTSPVRCID